MSEHAASVPGWKGSYQRREAVELDAALTRGLGPGELAGVPFDEGFGFRRDVEVLVKAWVRLADLGVSELDEQPIALTVRAAGPTFHFALRASVDKSRAALRRAWKSKRMTTRRSGSRSRRSALHIDHRATKGSRFSGAISSQRAPHSPSDWQTLKRSCPADVSS